MMKSSFALFIILFSLLASAQTKFEMLKKEYLNATQPAHPQDLPDYDSLMKLLDSNKYNCASVLESDPDTLLTNIARSAEVIIPAKPATGPLFPAQPEKRYSVIAIGGYAEYSLTSEQLRVLFSDQIQGYDRVQISTSQSFSSLEGQKTADGKVRFGKPKSDWRSEVRMRRAANGTMVYYGIDTSSGVQEVAYGYCFNP